MSTFNYAEFIPGKCQVCSADLEWNTICIAIDQPYYCVVHKRCFPFFRFSNGYPHEKPFEFYTHNTNLIIKKKEI
jgi:hypothetical protein